MTSVNDDWRSSATFSTARATASQSDRVAASALAHAGASFRPHSSCQAMYAASAAASIVSWVTLKFRMVGNSHHLRGLHPARARSRTVEPALTGLICTDRTLNREQSIRHGVGFQIDAAALVEPRAGDLGAPGDDR